MQIRQKNTSFSLAHIEKNRIFGALIEIHKEI